MSILKRAKRPLGIAFL